MRVRQIPILGDNYSHLVIDEASGQAAAVDPADPGPVCDALAEEGLSLTHVLCTHHHWDHAGGNLALRERFPEVAVVGYRGDERLPGLTDPVGPGDRVRVGALIGQVLFVPCHTSGHLAFCFGDGLFCGDTLFVAGCGRFFEGTGAQMHHNLLEVFGALPDETKIYCGHEYTVSNLRFALHIEPANGAAQAKLAWATERRQAGLSTVPSTLGEERAYNPFMRVDHGTVQRAVGADNPVDAMTALRAQKDQF